MDLDNPVIAKLLDKAFKEKFEQQMAIEKEKYQQELVIAMQRVTEVEAERREAEAKIATQWQELMLKVLEHRFKSVPVALIILLGSVKPEIRNRVSDLFLDATDVEVCLQELRQLVAEQK